jgi:hypothetical protein
VPGTSQQYDKTRLAWIGEQARLTTGARIASDRQECDSAACESDAGQND